MLKKRQKVPYLIPNEFFAGIKSNARASMVIEALINLENP